MTLARTWSVGLAGVHGAVVEVEVDMSAGVPGWATWVQKYLNDAMSSSRTRPSSSVSRASRSRVVSFT